MDRAQILREMSLHNTRALLVLKVLQGMIRVTRVPQEDKNIQKI